MGGEIINRRARQDLKNSMDNLLKIEGLTVNFKTDEGILRAVDGVTFHIRKGEVLGLVGESGCGKSVTAMTILGLIPSPPGQIVSGKILYEGQDILGCNTRELQSIRGREIGFIFQEPMTALSPLHRIGKQLVEALQLNRPMSKKEAWDLGESWLHKVGIPDARERMFAYPFQLSGGMRQRVMIAMALMLEPRLIIADEPTTALDVTIQAQIFSLMNTMIKNDTSLLLITHDMGVIWEMCDRVIVMYASKIVEKGSVEDVFGNPLHPYTKALIQAMPSVSVDTERLTTIDGQVPSALNYPRGCNFSDRCPKVMERCRADQPMLVDKGDDRSVACFLYDGSRDNA